MSETLMIYISATISFVFFAVGILFGWAANEVKHDQLYAKEIEENNAMHPEMYDHNGYVLNEELLSVRFTDDIEDLED
jgi:anaerobic C4-dicarboxylate transporter